MATQFQHRLVGTIILVALGVIFLPDLLDGKQPPMPEEVVSIPLRPELEPVQPVITPPEPARAETWTMETVQEAPATPPRPAPQPQPEVAQAPVSKPAPKAEPAPTPKPEPRPAPVVKPEPQPVAPAGGGYVAQLGAFRNADNVNALVAKLRAAGYRVNTTPSVPRQGELNRVWIGPDAKARLEQQLPALERLTGLKGKVLAK
ncbi:cell division protein DedD [Oceanimonas smirnovii]|uniref:cell division protein DedD n=1 Tax=Oceanimonas smirnovii TaxID=264574 RepID=UPI003FD4A305